MKKAINYLAAGCTNTLAELVLFPDCIVTRYQPAGESLKSI